MKHETRQGLWDPKYLMKTKFMGGTAKFHACSRPHSRVWVAQVCINKLPHDELPGGKGNRTRGSKSPLVSPGCSAFRKWCNLAVLGTVCKVGRRGWQWLTLSFRNVIGWFINIYPNVGKSSYVQSLMEPEQKIIKILIQKHTSYFSRKIMCLVLCIYRSGRCGQVGLFTWSRTK